MCHRKKWFCFAAEISEPSVAAVSAFRHQRQHFLELAGRAGGGLLAGCRLTGGPAVAVRSNVSAASVLFHWLDLSDPLAGSPGAKYYRISARTAGVRWAKWSRSRRRARSA